MQLKLALLAILVGLAASEPCPRAENHKVLMAAKANPLQQFNEWMATHGKGYSNDLSEISKRFSIWSANLDYVLEYNARHTSHWLGMNSMADLTTEEYRQLLGYDRSRSQAVNRPRTTFKYAAVEEDALPKALDWRKKGAVTEVKNQGQCGSCWAFSTTGSVEGINALVTGSLVSLSEQELVDCDRGQDNGCQGGLMDFAYQFIMKNGGIDTETDYPYEAVDGECDANKRNRHVVTIDGFEDIPENDEIALKKAVTHQPVSVAIEADQPSFQLYTGGVYDDTDCGTSLDHGVLVVGYGVDPKQGTYWIVKNSWGAQWGDNGYIKVKMGVLEKEGQCGIAMAASYPLKKGPNPSPEPEPSPTPGPKPSPSPKPDPSKPVKCDDNAECPAGTTCCCSSSLFGMCLQWGCCPMPLASCCSDGEHCCPHNLPVCDLDAGSCKKSEGDFFGAQKWSEKTPATVTRKSMISSLWDRVARQGVQL